MSLLLWLYPRAWRRQYGPEMRALLGQMRGRGRRLELALDLARGAADAHLHPQCRVRRWRRRLAAAAGVAVAALATGAVEAAAGPDRRPLAAGLLAVLWTVTALAWRWLGSRTLFVFSALLGARLAAEWVIGLGAARLDAAALPYQAGFAVLVSAAGGAVALLVLRGTRIRWPLAAGLGCLLELALGLALQRWSPLASLQPLRVVLWAAILAWLGRLGRPRPWDEPPEGAPVAARPSPRAPEPLSARARRAG